MSRSHNGPMDSVQTGYSVLAPTTSSSRSLICPPTSFRTSLTNTNSICNDRKWFEKVGFKEFQSFIATPDARTIPIARVKGVGTVIIPVIDTMINNIDGRGVESSGPLALANVLFVPNSRCNILCSVIGEGTDQRTDERVMFFPAEPDTLHFCLGELRMYPSGHFLAYIEPADPLGLKRIMLNKTIGLAESNLYDATTPDSLAMHWPDKQREEIEKDIKAKAEKDIMEAPLKKREHTWLRKTYKATFAEYMMSAGLDFDNPEDQNKVRWGIRQRMKEEKVELQKLKKLEVDLNQKDAEKEAKKEKKRQAAQDKEEGRLQLLQVLQGLGEQEHQRARQQGQGGKGETEADMGDKMEEEGEEREEDVNEEMDGEREEESLDEIDEETEEEVEKEKESSPGAAAETREANDGKAQAPAYLQYSQRVEAAKPRVKGSDNEEPFGQDGPQQSMNPYAIYSQKLTPSEEDDLVKLPNIKRDREL